MQITNAHVHMVDLEGMVRKYGGGTLPAGISVLSDIEAVLPLLRPAALLAQMDAAGIARSVLYAVEAPIVYASNGYVHELCSQYPDRLIGFASVNPIQEGAAAVLEAAVKELGLRGLKLHPPLQGFAPNDPAVAPVYRKAVELDIPVVFHVGTTPFGSLCRLAHANPLLVDDVAVEFPDLRIMLTHLGTLWHNEAFMVVEKNPNVFIDTAAYLYEIPQILTADLLMRIGPNKVIFGTDYPMPCAGRLHQMREFVHCVGSLGLSSAALVGIFQDNFETFLCGAEGTGDGVSFTDLASQLP